MTEQIEPVAHSFAELEAIRNRHAAKELAKLLSEHGTGWIASLETEPYDDFTLDGDFDLIAIAAALRAAWWRP